MNITKLGHCCLRIEVAGVMILTDPGNFSSGYDTVRGIDVVLITHEHADHCHVPSLLEVLEHNPKAQVITNSSVGKLLTQAGVPYTVLEGSATTQCCGVQLDAHDGRHEEIYEDIGQVQNTGYFIAKTLFYPGDSFHEPLCAVPVLALPVAGPWCKIADVIRYALAVNPKKAFPVHDGMLDTARIGSFHAAPQKVLSEHGIQFVPLLSGESADF
jgi:L-ascorbate metabolism protein UlaG (beta-lactamase superfamily)